MTKPGDDELQTVVYSLSHLDEAKALFDDAMSALAEGYPNIPRIESSRQRRWQRVIVAIQDREYPAKIVAQWIGARCANHVLFGLQNDLEAVASMGSGAKAAATRLEQAGAALRFEAITGDASRVAGDLSAIAGFLKDAEYSLALAERAANQILELLPEAARGRGGLTAALRQRAPNAELATKLAKYWQNRGLRLQGGEEGDGIDVILGHLLGQANAKKELTQVRRGLTSEPR